MKEQKPVIKDKKQTHPKFTITRHNSLGKLSQKSNQFKELIYYGPIDVPQKKNEEINYIATLLQENRDKIKSSLQQSMKCLYNNDLINSQCDCGRHLSKINAIKPEMNRGNSIYRNSYYGKSVEEFDKIIAKQSDRIKGDHLDMKSTYGKEFRNLQVKSLQKPKPKDVLKFQGPTPKLTTYSNLFPGHKGMNQYIKPADNIVRADVLFNTKSTYQSSFNPKQTTTLKCRLNDNLKLGIGSNWLATSTYRNVFQKPNPEAYLPIIKISEKLNSNPPDAHQFETIYRNDFMQKSSTVCPAKLKIQKNEINQNLQKSEFQQNADFKGMSQDFHTISTSKVFKGW